MEARARPAGNGGVRPGDQGTQADRRPGRPERAAGHVVADHVLTVDDDPEGADVRVEDPPCRLELASTEGDVAEDVEGSDAGRDPAPAVGQSLTGEVLGGRPIPRRPGGLAEAARLDGRLEGSAGLCEAGYRASAAVADAAYLFPFLLTGIRTYWALGRPAEAEDWFERVAAVIRRRAIPGTLPAVEHGAGLLLLGRGATRPARSRIAEAAAQWQRRRRSWQATWAAIDLARVELRSKRLSAAVAGATSATSEARRLGSPPLEAAASVILRAATGRRRSASGDAVEAWAPLTTREYEVALRIAAGATNAEIAAALGIAPKTVSAHVEHILNRLGLARRAEIAAWVASIEVRRRQRA